MDRNKPEGDMARAKYKDVILETIDQLRKRKARPDLERICHMVERRHGLTFEETEADLEKLVDSEIVIKVDYKGSTSYRNAAKWRKSHLGGNVLNSNDASRKLQTVVGALTEAKLKGPREAIEERGGVSINEIERQLIEEDTSTNLTETHLQITLNREVEAGRLQKLPSGNYGLADPDTSPPKSKPTGPGAPAKAADSPAKKGRPAGKRKVRCKNLKENKIKRPHLSDEEGMERSVFKERKDRDQEEREEELQREAASASRSAGPSPDSYPSQRPSSQPQPRQSPHQANQANPAAMYEEMEARCDYCLFTSECNRNGRAENLLFCKDCQAKAHPSCMDYSEDLAKRARNSPWQCIDCKTCYVCEDSGDPDAMLFCDACDKGYHMNCHNPPIEEKPTGKWVCSKCVLELGIEGEAMDTTEVQDKEVNQTNSQVNNNNTSNINNNTDSGGASCLPTPSESPVHFQEDPVQLPNPTADHKEQKHSSMLYYRLTGKMPNGHGPPPPPPPSIPRLADTLPAEVPDASEWTIDDVVHFFREVGFIDQADVFREQEIDGRSLLLMKRSDVLTGLSLKLGPALKIYTHVQRLQMRGDVIM